MNIINFTFNQNKALFDNNVMDLMRRLNLMDMEYQTYWWILTTFASNQQQSIFSIDL